MKRILIPLLWALIASTSYAQTNDEKAVFDLLKKNSAALGLSDNDIANSVVTTSYIITNTNIRMVYLQQTYKGLPVFNKLNVLAFRDGKPVSVAGERVASMEKVAIPENGIPVVAAPAAVLTAIRESNVSFGQNIQPVSVTDNGRNVQFGDLGISYNGITASLMWVPDATGKVQLAWQVYISPKNSHDHWLIRISANNNTVINKNNLVVTCSWDKKEQTGQCNDNMEKAHIHHIPAPAQQQKNQMPFIINGATYNVIPFPSESPIHPGGTPANRTDPWLLSPAGSNATTLKWHSNGTTDYTTTRGNNVFAYEDTDGNNAGGVTATSSTSDPLTFNNAYNFTLAPNGGTNQQSAIVNLFYWNNIIHDVSYLYGFDEVSGNYQTNNQGRGGLGNDAVLAEAQDGSDMNNARFFSFADGTAGRMEMYLWNAPNPDRDGDLDNGIILHEYTHGISTRFTGGPANPSCLANDEQMGEGWSDYFALMITQDWATSVATDGFNNPRGIATYALNQPTTGVGIRQYPYTTNMAVNPHTYTNVATAAIPHGIGSIWCAMLWDMTWNMIQMDGITTDIYNAGGTGGNVRALKLVTEGMRLQPCSPGFVDGRNAILRADTLFFGARYSCAIWDAFARRGVGINASQGLSTSRSDQTADFTIPVFNLGHTQNVSQQAENQDITYTESTRALCQAIANYKVVDTLPTNVTYVSGGTYNAGDRTVTFSGINLAMGASRNDNFTVKVNAGSYFAPTQHINEQVTGATIPASWAATSTTANVWAVSSAQSASPPNSFFTPDAAIASEQILATTGSYAISGLTTLSFQHRYITEVNWDGGVVEISTNGGGAWSDLGNFITNNGYSGTLGTGSALGGRKAFTGNSGAAFITTTIDLSSFRGQSIRLRFRFASDVNTGGTGWYVDNINLISEAAVIMKANLFNSSNVLQGSKEVAAKITLAVVPLRLVSFGGFLDNNDARLQWITENENGMRMFEVERNFDGASFTSIKQVDAANRSTRTEYNAVDANITAQSNTGVVYYRLKMIDRNGEISYSRIVKINLGKNAVLSIAPNPVKDQLMLTGFTDNRRYEAVITDVTGKIVISTIVSAVDNTINTAMLEKGMYVLQVRNSGDRNVYRFIKD